MVGKLDKKIPEEVEDELLERENVIGVGRGRRRVDGRFTDEEVIVTFVEKKVEEEELDENQIVPQSLEIEDQDVDTDVQEAPGGFYALQQQPPQTSSAIPHSEVATGGAGAGRQTASQPAAEPQAVTGSSGQTRHDRWRPLVPAGVSIGHPEISFGTLGSPPLITQGGERVFLTNAHVAAPMEQSERGDSCLQPGRYHGGTDPDDKIGELLEWSELSENEVNTSDSALVEITGNVDNDILGVGPLRGWAEANYEEQHTKSGARTGTTGANLIARDVTAVINYRPKLLRFSGLDVFESFSAGGDSGSLVGIQRQNGSFYGTDLLFAGSVEQTLAIPMAAVQEEHGKLRVQKKPQMNDQQQQQQTGPVQTGQSPSQGPSEVPPNRQQGQRSQAPTQQNQPSMNKNPSVQPLPRVQQSRSQPSNQFGQVPPGLSPEAPPSRMGPQDPQFKQSPEPSQAMEAAPSTTEPQWGGYYRVASLQLINNNREWSYIHEYDWYDNYVRYIAAVPPRNSGTYGSTTINSSSLGEGYRRLKAFRQNVRNTWEFHFISTSSGGHYWTEIDQ